jgi:hypothetical protein
MELTPKMGNFNQAVHNVWHDQQTKPYNIFLGIMACFFRGARQVRRCAANSANEIACP